MPEPTSLSHPPMLQFAQWYEAAKNHEPSLPNAMSLATVSPEGKPAVRIVLMKTFSDQGFVFYTNLGSPKVKHLEANPQGALCFHWKSLAKQVRVEGRVSPVSFEEADDYFASRPRESQIGAYASRQSEPLESHEKLLERYKNKMRQFEQSSIPRPPFWSGFVLRPEAMEFWAEKPHRLHERVLWERAGDRWAQHLLYP